MPRIVRIAGPALLLVVAFASLFAALAFGHAADAPRLIDPGALVRYGLPIATMLFNLGVAVTLGSLVLLCFAMSADRPEFARTLDIAAGAAGFWAIASAVTGFLTFMSFYTKPISLDANFGGVLGDFLTNKEIGQAWLASTLVAAVVTVLCFAVRNRTMLVFVTAFAAVGLVPQALQGHSADAAGHDAAVTSLGLHVVFAAIWLGGLVTIVFIRKTLEGGRIGPIISRYSTLAIICFVVVAASGYVNAALRVGTITQLLTPYGILVLVKIFALLALGLFGLGQRRFLVAKMQSSANSGNRFFWWLIAAELGFMGLASGVAAALAKTATPVSQDATLTSPAWILTQAPLPPELTFSRYFTTWNFDNLWVLLIAFLAFFYIAGVVRLHRRGDKWPVHRLVVWLAGLGLLFWVTNGGINAYEKYLFSVHMLGHMLLGMMIPVLLVPAAPITLALRAIAKRSDGSRGAREWIMLFVHSRASAVLSNPIVAAALFVVSLWVFYYTPLFSWATTDHIGHTWMIVHFLITGYLFVQALIGVDPLPYRAPYPMRLLVLLGTMAFHAFFGLSLITGTGLLLANWYGAMGRAWGVSAIADQQTGGGIAWSVGEIPTIILAITVAIMWSKSDAKDARRLDRKAERDGDAELLEYNRMLADRAGRR
ncbi:cytochrome c oxidase assembly protein [Glaciihabitans sp. INWT7]|uniref:cytochrome c oxidase assembly protein n=1 Tax=Glaciihabitans sp. INWT7 TaxID=2596912 RepID=UPI001C641609|nr:cytochrome c oxidase assembly protein [Glaciihabitans sp. INWT7]